METKVTKDGVKLVMAVSGRMDTVAAQSLGDEMNAVLTEDVKEFELDLADCPYIASSGLRVILQAQKKMNSMQGSMVVKNVIGDVMEVFEMTGFSDILTFE